MSLHEREPRGLEEGRFQPRTGWPWRPTRTLEPPLGPSADPELEALEARIGLTAEVAWGFARLAPKILGPLIDIGPTFRPLSMTTGRLVAIELHAMPDLPGLHEWLRDVRHVQTSSVAVCAELADGTRSFVVDSEACERAVLERTDARLVRRIERRCNEDEGWLGRPDLNPRFVPLIRLSYAVWLAWDRDAHRPVSVMTGKGDRHFVFNGALLGSHIGPQGPVPYRVPPHPGGEESLRAASGSGWAAAVRRMQKTPLHVVTAPGNWWAAILPTRMNTPTWGNEFAHFWRHHPAHPLRGMPYAYQRSIDGAGVSIHLDAKGRLELWHGGMFRVFVWRKGALDLFARPETLLDQVLASPSMYKGEDPIPTEMLANIETRSIGLAPLRFELVLSPGERLLVCTESVLEHVGLEVLAERLGDDPYRAANDIEMLLESANAEGLALIFSPDATTEPAYKGWLPALDVTLAPQNGDAPIELPRWRIVRGFPVQDPYAHLPHVWFHALRKVVERAHPSPERGDILEVILAKDRYFRLQFDGTDWQPFQNWGWSDKGVLREGPLQFPEDTPSERLESAWAEALRTPATLATLAQVAEEEGCLCFAQWLRLIDAHRRGEPVAGFFEAKERVSPRARARCAPFVQSEDVDTIFWT